MPDIKELIAKYVDPAKVDEAVAELNKELPLLYIPKTKFNEVNDELKIAKEQLVSTNKSVEDLTKKASTIEEYQKQIEDLKNKTVELETNAKNQIATITKKTKLKDLLVENGVHKDAIDLMVEKYLPDTEVDDTGIKDAKKLINRIKEEKGGLFVTVSTNSDDKGEGKGKPAGKPDDARLKKLFGLGITNPGEK